MALELNGTTGITTPDVDSSADISANGVSVGRGAGSVASNTAVGASALAANTTGSNSTAIGYRAGYTSATGAGNTFVGFQSGYTSAVSGDAYNTCIGAYSGSSLTTGASNTFIGTGATSPGSSGSLITSGSKNTIVGAYNGNQQGLDIRTLNSVCVVSDGDGLPQISTYRIDSSSAWGNFDITAGISGGSASNAWLIAAGTATAFSGFGGGFMSGIMVINDISVTGSTAMFIFGGSSTVTKISESAGTNNFQVNNSSPTGQQTGLYFSGATLYIKPAQTTYYRIWVLRTRTSL